tara:strand:+ start:200 stop:424 length:225 start_codon:yes stop_codon:yes gene_type:complete
VNLISDHVKELVQFQQLSPTQFRPTPNNVDPDKYWRYFSKFPNEFARGLDIALQEENMSVYTYDHLANIITINS